MIKSLRDNNAELLLKLSGGGVQLADHHYQQIRIAGLQEEAEISNLLAPIIDPEMQKGHLWLFSIPIATEGDDAGQPLEGTCYFDKIPKEWIEEYRDVEITKQMWRPRDPRKMDAEFKRFINSHIPQFDQIIPYKEFYLYCEQARRWLEDTRTIADIDPLERVQYKWQELDRVSENKLYGLNKYVSIKEDGFIGGRRKFEASTPQALLAFLVDRGNSFELVKGRQAAITSTMLAMAALESVVRNAFSCVFLVHKKDGTGKPLFRNKFQSTFQHLPQWMIGEVDVAKGFSTESAIIDFDPATEKIRKGRDVAEVRLLSSEDSMNINGQTPTWSLFDESQNVPTFQLLKGEIDPTMYQFSMSTGRMELMRQCFAWGTGSSNNTGNGSFENDYKGLLETWQSGEETDGWIPVFMDWTCRPGMSREFYSMQRRKYLQGKTEETKGLNSTERLALFKAHYPSAPDDAFMTSHKTVVPMEIIIKQQNRIQAECIARGLGPIPGRFEAIWDQSITLPEGSGFQHPVKGVRWVPSLPDDIEAPILMFMPPDNAYAHRYFQGTDPIQNDGGFSRFSSAIWDSVGRVTESGSFAPGPVCVLNARTTFAAELFMQSALMGMYYRNYGQKACRELVEINVGHRYADFKCSAVLNLRDSLMTRHELLPKYKIGQASNVYGIDLKGGKGSRKEMLYGDLTDLVRAYGHNIWYMPFWSQLRNISVESDSDGAVKWGTRNKNVYNDDLVYAIAYAELCSRCVNKQPEPVTPENKKFVTKKVIKRRPGTMMPYTVYEKAEVKAYR